MGLVNCPDCGRAVSDLAPACPGCARPMKATETQPVTIQQTSKPYKGAEAVGVALLILGLVSTAWHLAMGAVVALVGLTLWISARLGAWWHNG